ncbi:MAG: helix-turn-helix transcriptional regulator [Alicyclobacillaceae bacterium]|nr:helix-turn-helix transcriptional regulator [Alicyclobacillaceae bacterium]
MSLGKRLRQTRLRRGLTQSQLAERLGMTEANLSNYERDRTTPPSERLQQIAEILDVTTDYLLGRTDDPHGYAEYLGREDAQLKDGIEFITRARERMSDEAYARFLQISKQIAEMMENGDRK